MENCQKKNEKFKKAAAAGIDLDEFEMVLSARLYEKQQKNNSQANTIPVIPQSSTPPPVQPIPQAQQNVNNNKMGDLRKCPACNAIVQSYSAICADCGHSFSNISAVSSVTKLHEQLIAVESEERERESNEKNQPSQKSSLFSSFDPSASLKAYKSLTTNIEEIILTRKASIISSFPIPNSKEDILEFLTMAVPECKNKPNFMMMATGKGKIYKAWFTKAEQIVMKAKFSLKEDKKAMEEITYYANQINIKVN
jgi:hypothetical protein